MLKRLRITLCILLALTWQQRLAVAQVNAPTYSALASPGLSLITWFSQLSQVYFQVVGVRIFADSIASCYQTDAGCSGFGPQYSGNRWPSLLLNAATQAGFPIFGNGIQPCIGTVISIAFELQGPYTSTGTIVSGNQVGPSQAIGASPTTGGSICNMSAGATITYPAGHAFYAARFYCGETSSNNTIAVTIGGTSVGNICASTTGTTVAAAQTILNPAGTTSAQIVLTASGQGLYYGLELQYTSANYGLVIHNEGVGAANSYFFGGNTTQNLAFSDQFFGSHALAIVSLGVNDQAGAIGTSAFTTNINYVLNHEQSFGSSTLIANEYVWTGTGSTNTSLRPTNLTIAQSLANPAPSDYLDFQDVLGPITPAQSYAMGCLQSDTTHNTDLCALAIAQQFSQHLFVGRMTPTGAVSFGTNQTQGGYTTGYQSFQNSTDANPNFNIFGCFFASLATCNIMHGTTASGNWFWGINGAAAQTNLGAGGGVMSIGSYYIGFGPANSQTVTGFPAIADYTSHLFSRPYNIVVLGANGTGSAYTNGTTGTFTNVGDGTHTLQFAINASETGSVKCMVPYSASAITVGAAFKWAYTGTMTSFIGSMDYDATTATAGVANIVRPAVVTAIGTQQPATPTVVATAANTYVANFDVTYVASTAGTLTLTGEPSATGTLTIPLGAKCVKD